MALKDWQLRVVEYMEDNDGLLVVHGTGSGKTLTAVTCSQCYLDAHPERRIVFVGPAGLKDNFRKEMMKYGVENIDKYDLYSYEDVMNAEKRGTPLSFKNKFLIVDEAHNRKTENTLMTDALVRASFEADKRLVLTATPFINSIKDFTPLINMVHGRFMTGNKMENLKELTDLNNLRVLLRDRVDVMTNRDKGNYPTRIDHYVDVPMDKDYYERYKQLAKSEEINGQHYKDPNTFYHGFRQAVNKAGAKEYVSSKIIAAVDILKIDKSIIFTSWLEYGVELIKERLVGSNYAVISGNVPIIQRQKIVNDFNNNKIDILILTTAGQEGIDLKGVRKVVILDPPWNESGLEQMIGRAVRYNSHVHLPEDERIVDVYLIRAIPPIGVKEGEVKFSDKEMYRLIEEKKKANSQIISLLISAGISK